MFITIPIHLNVYVCVYVSVSVCMCLFCTLDVSECNPFIAVHFFYCIVVELLLLFYIFAVLQSHQFIGVCV